LSAKVGAGWAAIAGVSPYVDERSVQARSLSPQVRVLSTRVVYRAHLERAMGREEIDALEREQRLAERQREAANLAHDRAARDEWRVKSLTMKWLDAVSAVPRGARGEEALASWREALASLDRKSAE